MKRSFFKYLAIILCLSVLCCTFSAYAAPAEDEGLTNWSIRIYNDENGLPTSEANAVLCTSDGYMWIGSYGGLIRYDGRTFLNFSTEEDGIPVSSIRSLYESRAGILYIGTSSGIYTWDGRSFSYVESADGTVISSVYDFCEDSRGNVYAGSSDGLMVITEDGRTHSADPGKCLSGTVYSIVCDSEGFVWGVDLDGSLFSIRDGECSYYSRPDKSSSKSYYSVEIVTDGENEDIYAGTSENDIYVFRIGGNGTTAGKAKKINTGTVHTLNKLYYDGADTVWIAGVNGAGRVSTSSRSFSTDGELLQCTSLNCIVTDYQSNIWLSSSNYGVFEITSGSVYHPVEALSLKNESVTGIAKCEDMLFVGTSNGLYVLDSTYAEIATPLTEMLSGIYVRCVMEDADGDVWISTYNSDYGLVCYSTATGDIDCFTSEQGINTVLIRSTLQLADGRIAVATGQGLYILSKEKGIAEEYYGEAEGLTGTLLLSLSQSPDGTLYIATDNSGIFSLKSGIISEVSGSGIGSVLRTAWDESAGGMWLSNSSSLWFMDEDETFTEMTAFKAGIGSIFDIFSVDDSLYLVKSSGIYKISKDELLQGNMQNVKVFDSREGLSGSGVSNSWSCHSDDCLYICTSKGISIIDLSEEAQDHALPKVVIEKIVYEDGSETETIYADGESFTLPRTTERLTVYFSCLNYTKHEFNVFYHLEGFGEDAKSVGSSEAGVASYTNLPGGDYCFSVFAEDSFGNIGGAVQREFEKEYKLTEHKAFMVAAVLGFFAAGGILTRIAFHARVKKVQAEKERYRSITRQALETIAHTIDAKDKYTNGHSKRVAEYSVEMGKRMGMNEEELEKLYYIALLHDIGKIGIPDRVLNKPGMLSDEEFQLMRGHTSIGGEILKDFKLIDGIAAGAVGHHERYDGKGYPNGLNGRENILTARIISVADAYDAMATDRPYRKHLSRDYAISEIERGRGTQFDPDIADVMLEYLRSLPEE